MASVTSAAAVISRKMMDLGLHCSRCTSLRNLPMAKMASPFPSLNSVCWCLKALISSSCYCSRDSCCVRSDTSVTVSDSVWLNIWPLMELAIILLFSLPSALHYWIDFQPAPGSLVSFLIWLGSIHIRQMLLTTGIEI